MKWKAEQGQCQRYPSERSPNENISLRYKWNATLKDNFKFSSLQSSHSNDELANEKHEWKFEKKDYFVLKWVLRSLHTTRRTCLHCWAAFPLLPSSLRQQNSADSDRRHPFSGFLRESFSLFLFLAQRCWNSSGVLLCADWRPSPTACPPPSQHKKSVQVRFHSTKACSLCHWAFTNQLLKCETSNSIIWRFRTNLLN